MRLNANVRDQIPGGTTEGTRLAVTGDAHLVPVARARRDANLHLVPAVLKAKAQLRALDGRDEVDRTSLATSEHLHLRSGTAAPAARRAAAEQVAEQIAETLRTAASRGSSKRSSTLPP